MLLNETKKNPDTSSDVGTLPIFSVAKLGLFLLLCNLFVNYFLKTHCKSSQEVHPNVTVAKVAVILLIEQIIALDKES